VMPKLRLSLMSLLLLMLPLQLQATDLYDVWQQASSKRYMAMTAAEYEEAVHLFSLTLQADSLLRLPQQWQQLGFDLKQQGQWMILTEIKAQGRGLFIFCPTCKTDVVLQAPHAFRDLHTGKLALLLVQNRSFKALALNTLPRNEGADTAHFKRNYQTAFAAAVVQTVPVAQLVQLHGFSNSKRKTEVGKSAEIILSNGHRLPNRDLAQLAYCLRSAGIDNTYLFPQQVSELGGTGNAQAKQLRQLGSDRFVHFEMNYELRKRAVNEPETLYRLAHCLLEGVKR